MQDPYRILGISPSASEDEIKKAYRSMAKKYHPDVNNGSPEAEQKMKEVNEAYSTLMKMRREGASNASSGYSSGYSQGYGGYQNAHQSYGYSSSPQLQAARNFIHSGRYQEAFNLLEQMSERGPEWYYLCGEASLGLGNRIAALNYARRAVSMDPNNFEYRALLSRLESSSHFYQSAGSGHGFGMPSMLCNNPCITCCLIESLCNCLCNGCFCPGGYYRTC